MGKTLCVLDTNIFMHFRRAETLDWHELLKTTDDIELVIVPAVMSELEELKFTGGREWLKERAKERVRWITQTLGDSADHALLPNGVVLRHVLEQAPVAVGDVGNRDEEVRASLDALRRSGERLVFVSHDRGARRLAKQRGHETFSLPDEFELPSESDRPAKSRAAIETRVWQRRSSGNVLLDADAVTTLEPLRVPRLLTSQEAYTLAERRLSLGRESGTLEATARGLENYAASARADATRILGRISIRNAGTEMLENLVVTTGESAGFRRIVLLARGASSNLTRPEPLHVEDSWDIDFAADLAEPVLDSCTIRLSVVSKQFRRREQVERRLRVSIQEVDAVMRPLPTLPTRTTRNWLEGI